MGNPERRPAPRTMTNTELPESMRSSAMASMDPGSACSVLSTMAARRERKIWMLAHCKEGTRGCERNGSDEAGKDLAVSTLQKEGPVPCARWVLPREKPNIVAHYGVVVVAIHIGG